MNRLLVAALLLTVVARADEADITATLARDLADEGRHEQAALEYRRLAAMQDLAADSAAGYWAAAHEYWRGGEYDSASRMLDRMEEQSREHTLEALLLRSETARAGEAFSEGSFYLESLLRAAEPGELRDLAGRRLSSLKLLSGDPTGAEAALADLSSPCPAALQAVHDYRDGQDKSPRIGGLLGMVPGLGYAYSGEHANAVRSFILNGLFIFAMTDTAGDEEWGAFTAITFFELTWYSGSIYGGIDAAHRYNRDRLAQAVSAVDGNSGFTFDARRIPAIELKFRF